MDKKSYSLSRDERNHESVIFEYDNVDGYLVKPKISKKDSIEVSKILFVDDSLKKNR